MNNSTYKGFVLFILKAARGGGGRTLVLTVAASSLHTSFSLNMCSNGCLGYHTIGLLHSYRAQPELDTSYALLASTELFYIKNNSQQKLLELHVTQNVKYVSVAYVYMYIL